MSTTLGWKDMGIRKLESVAKTQFLILKFYCIKIIINNKGAMDLIFIDPPLKERQMLD